MTQWNIDLSIHVPCSIYGFPVTVQILTLDRNISVPYSTPLIMTIVTFFSLVIAVLKVDQSLLFELHFNHIIYAILCSFLAFYGVPGFFGSTPFPRDSGAGADHVDGSLSSFAQRILPVSGFLLNTTVGLGCSVRRERIWLGDQVIY